MGPAAKRWPGQRPERSARPFSSFSSSRGIVSSCCPKLRPPPVRRSPLGGATWAGPGSFPRAIAGTPELEGAVRGGRVPGEGTQRGRVCRPPERFAGGRPPSGPPHPFPVLSQLSRLTEPAPTIARETALPNQAVHVPRCQIARSLHPRCLFPSLGREGRALVRAHVPSRRLLELRGPRSPPTCLALSWA